MQRFLKSTPFLDFNHPKFVQYAQDLNLSKQKSSRTIAITLFDYVRDAFPYDPMAFQLHPKAFQASSILAQGRGFCVQKAILLAALARFFHIPSKLGFANLLHHQLPPTLKKILKTNLIAFHGYTLLYINHTWVKATPTFETSLCIKLQIPTLSFDGLRHTTLPAFNLKGQKFVDYVRDWGSFDDLPYTLMTQTFCQIYPHLLCNSSQN